MDVTRSREKKSRTKSAFNCCPSPPLHPPRSLPNVLKKEEQWNNFLLSTVDQLIKWACSRDWSGRPPDRQLSHDPPKTVAILHQEHFHKCTRRSLGNWNVRKIDLAPLRIGYEENHELRCTNKYWRERNVPSEVLFSKALYRQALPSPVDVLCGVAQCTAQVVCVSVICILCTVVLCTCGGLLLCAMCTVYCCFVVVSSSLRNWQFQSMGLASINHCTAGVRTVSANQTNFLLWRLSNIVGHRVAPISRIISPAGFGSCCKNLYLNIQNVHSLLDYK